MDVPGGIDGNPQTNRRMAKPIIDNPVNGIFLGHPVIQHEMDEMGFGQHGIDPLPLDRRIIQFEFPSPFGIVHPPVTQGFLPGPRGVLARVRRIMNPEMTISRG
jgi:hypothetical protein